MEQTPTIVEQFEHSAIENALAYVREIANPLVRKQVGVELIRKLDADNESIGDEEYEREN